MSRSMQVVLLWAGTSTLACMFALSWLPAAFDGDTYYPIGVDSFYHARRILDAVAAPEAYYEFDPLIHAPEGSLLVWPWAYDRVAAAIVSGVKAVSTATDPMAVLSYLPVACTPINVALVIAVGVLAGLPRWGVVFVAFAYCVSPLTRELHAVGRIDHHYVEHLFFLASLAAGMAYLKAPSPARAVMLGLVLGTAPAFHNGLFMLQGFFGVTVFVLWLRGLLALGRTTRYFAAALLVSTLAVLLPSEPFVAFEWHFYYLGWFHLSAAIFTATAIWWLSGHGPQRGNILAFVSVAGIIGLAADRPRWAFPGRRSPRAPRCNGSPQHRDGDCGGRRGLRDRALFRAHMAATRDRRRTDRGADPRNGAPADLTRSNAPRRRGFSIATAAIPLFRLADSHLTARAVDRTSSCTHPDGTKIPRNRCKRLLRCDATARAEQPGHLSPASPDIA